jgi:hypothetical protein
MALFDYGTMVIFKFRDQNISTTDNIDGLVVSETLAIGSAQLTIRQALFVLIQEGYDRIMEERRRGVTG